MAKKQAAALLASPSDELLELAEFAIEAHKEWIDDPVGPDSPPEPFWRAVEALIDHACQMDSIADTHALLMDAVDHLATEQAMFDALSMETGTARPHNEFWVAFEGLQRRVSSLRREAPKLESVKVLHERGVSHRQIAAMYGWRDENGREQAELVSQELDEPGSVTANRPAPQKTPNIRPCAPQSTAMQLRRQDLERTAAKRSKPKPKPCDESPIHLWAIGVLPDQAALMLCQSVEEVRAQWQQFAETHGDRELLSADQLRRLVREAGNATPKQPEISPEAAERYRGESDERLRERCRAASIGDTGTRAQLIAKLEAVEALA